jgi:hypothetical protein
MELDYKNVGLTVVAVVIGVALYQKYVASRINKEEDEE